MVGGLGSFDTAIVVAGICTVFAIVMSMYLIHTHLSNYVNPMRQRYIIRIVWMVPIYALHSFVSLCFVSVAIFFEVPRDVYESYVIYNFVALMIDCMGGDEVAQAFFAAEPPQIHWWPFGCLGEHDMTVFLATCRLCTLQYSIVRPTTAVVSLISYYNGTFDEADLSASSSYLWVLLLNNTSVTIALYYLVYFYHASLPCEELQQSKPLSKFLAIKAVVFFCFWQYCLINALGTFGVIDRTLAHRSEGATLTGLNDFIICLEMAFFSVLNIKVFSAKEFKLTVLQAPNLSFPIVAGDDMKPNLPIGLDGVHALTYREALRDMFYFGDVATDVKSIVREFPRVMYYGCGKVRDASRARSRGRAHRRMELAVRRSAHVTTQAPAPAAATHGADDHGADDHGGDHGAHGHGGNSHGADFGPPDGADFGRPGGRGDGAAGAADAEEPANPLHRNPVSSGGGGGEWWSDV
ncbi:organic solute transporter Ostalpha-domain-containing protein [Pelagophyceae sp. CCMP2097]|nr:organic solute transporter Ostalpha-domain-containing protein [Pelagophyceae sp. CCMP2097]